MISSVLHKEASTLEVNVTEAPDTLRKFPWRVTLAVYIASNRNLKYLRLVNDFRTTFEDLRTIFQALEDNQSLKSLVICDRTSRDPPGFDASRDRLFQNGDYAEGLASNSSLLSLEIVSGAIPGDKLTYRSLGSLASALKKNKKLRRLKFLDGILTEVDLKNLYDAVIFNTSLVEFSLPGHLSSCKWYQSLMTLALKNSENDTAEVESDLNELKELELTVEDHIHGNEELEPTKEGTIAVQSDRSILSSHIPFNEITLGQRIGAGGYGEVLLAQWRNQNVAVKKALQPSSDDRSILEAMVHESATVQLLEHKHIVSAIGTTVTVDALGEPTEIMLVMEYMEHGALENLLFRRNVQLPPGQLLRIALDIAKGLNYLHCLTPKIIHRDLKCANILLYQNKSRAKISDFGTARFLNQDSLATTVVGTPGYIAPELLFGNTHARTNETSFKDGYNEKADVYSFGIVSLMLATSTKASLTTRDDHVLRAQEIEGHMKTSNSYMADDKQFKQLVLDCCDINPAKRPSMKQCIDTLKLMRQNCNPIL